MVCCVKVYLFCNLMVSKSKYKHIYGTILVKIGNAQSPDVWCHMDKSPDDWLNFSVFIGMIGIVCIWPCVIIPWAPIIEGSKVTVIDPKCLANILHHTLMRKLTTSVPEVISVHNFSLSLSTSIYWASTCAKQIFGWKIPWQTLTDERCFFFLLWNHAWLLSYFIRFLPKEMLKYITQFDC